jgi:hypothetical protein
MSLGVGHEDIPQRNGHEANQKPSVQDLSRCQHGFHTDTSPERYHSQAAKEAWSKTFEFFHAGFAQLTGSAKDAPVRVNTEILQFPFSSIAAAASRPSAC